MKVLVIEDEEFAADKLISMLHEYEENISILEVIDSVEDAVDYFRHHKDPDLVFMDIHLADGSSFEIFNQVKVEIPIIFTTAYDQYAIQAFKSRSVDYLLKPIAHGDLTQALEKFKSFFTGSSDDHSMLEEIKAITSLMLGQQKAYKSRFLVKVGNLIKSIDISEVSYFMFEDRVTLLVAKDGRRYPIKQNMDDLEEDLDPSLYFRANRQFIVGIHSIDKIHPYFKGRLKLELVPKQHSDLVVSFEKARHFKAWLDL